MYSTPLDDYFSAGGRRPPLRITITALWRGYVGSWEIVDDRLHLVQLQGELENGSELSLATVFPAAGDKVFADWYSGQIRIPDGERLKYVHGGFMSIHERDVLLDVVQGVVVTKQVRHNQVDETSDRLKFD